MMYNILILGFTIPPTCNIQPREQPLVFYDKEPIKVS